MHLYVNYAETLKNPESRDFRDFSQDFRDFSRDFQIQFPILGCLRISHSGFYRGFHMLILSPGVLKFSGFFTRIVSWFSNPDPNPQDLGILEIFRPMPN